MENARGSGRDALYAARASRASGPDSTPDTPIAPAIRPPAVTGAPPSGKPARGAPGNAVQPLWIISPYARVAPRAASSPGAIVPGGASRSGMRWRATVVDRAAGRCRACLRRCADRGRGRSRLSGWPARHQRASSPHAAVEAERSLACAVLQCGDGTSLRSGPAALRASMSECALAAPASATNRSV
ncbi:hypothetical protein MYA_3474 [Burkholderia sp. KJ006]|nr:hypothetical protein MYA_3474 [Burkholderia sp. KJ006]